MNESQKRKIKKLISWGLTIAAVIFMGWYLYQNREIFTNLQAIRTLDIILIALLRPISIAFGAVINKLIIDTIDQEIPYTDALLLQFANNFVNRFIAQGGAVYRSAYLKTQYAFPFSKFLASIGGVYIIGLMTNAGIGLVLVLIFFFLHGVFNLYMIALLMGLLFGTIGLLLINPKFKPKFWLLEKFNQVISGWHQIKNNPGLIINIAIFSALELINSSIIVLILFRGLNVQISFLDSFFYTTISALANIINLTPGGLGINEAILMFTSDIFGLTSEIVLLGSLLLRAISMLTAFTFGAMSYAILNYRLQKTKKHEITKDVSEKQV